MQTDDISARVDAYIEGILPEIFKKVRSRTKKLADNAHFNFYRYSLCIAGDEAMGLLSDMIPAFGYNGSVRDLSHILQARLMADMERHTEEYGLYRESGSTIIMKKGLLEKMREVGDKIIFKNGRVNNREITLQISLQPTREEIAFVRSQTLSHYEKWGWQKTVEGGINVYKHSDT